MPEVIKHEASSPRAHGSPKKPKTVSAPQDESQLASTDLLAVQSNASKHKLLVKKNVEGAQLPRRSSPHAAGYDLAASASVTIPAKGKAQVDTGLSISIPAGHYGRIAPRSSLAHKHFIDVGAGVIDADYRGPLIVILFNFSDEDFKVQPGDRIAQLIIEKIEHPEVDEVKELDETVRGAGGFGSTGK